MVRIVQHNDWVVMIIIGCILLYVFMLLYLHRDSSVKEFLLQKLADSSNNFLSWLIISVVFVVLLATLISQSIPIVPKRISDIHFLGYELNKLGFTLGSLIIFYSIKSAFTYVFFAGTGSVDRWFHFQFNAAKFYFTFSLALMVLCFYQYFYEVHSLQLFDYYFIGFSVAFLFKIFFYLLSPNNILPEKWYYKFLYICTLQIIPVLVLWSVLFF